MTKRRRYRASGVHCYWIVDLDARLIEEWRPGADRPTILDRAAEWRPDPSVPAAAKGT